ncbi:MAG: hypothetical protein M3R46_07680 [Actinomycetota bacterium]|nr:hypothetical protein [Actinomycetota bacterium]
MPDHPTLHPGAHAPRGSEEGNRFSPTGVEMLTVTKRMVPLDNPQPEHIDIRDIARALSAQVRFAGHCALQPTIAQHSLAVEWIAAELLGRTRAQEVGDSLRRAALMHDSAEAYVGDLIGAVKLLLRSRKAGEISEFDHLEARVMVAIEKRYDCAPLPEHRALIHEADCLACAYEMAYAGWCPAAQPPVWVARSSYLATTYGSADGGAGAITYGSADAGAFLRRARALEMV